MKTKPANIRVVVYMKPHEHRRAKADAALAGMDLSRWVRTLLVPGAKP